MEGTTPAVRPYRMIAATVTWLVLAYQLYMTLSWYSAHNLSVAVGFVGFLSYFTILTNLLAAIVLSVRRDTAGPLGRFFARPSVAGGVTVYMIAVVLAYLILLRPISHSTGLQITWDILLNIVTPLLYIGYWFSSAPKGYLRGAHVGWWLIYPALYFVWTLSLSTQTGYYAYPYLDLGKLGEAGIAQNCAIALVAIAVLGLIVVMIDRRMAGAPLPEERAAA